MKSKISELCFSSNKRNLFWLLEIEIGILPTFSWKQGTIVSKTVLLFSFSLCDWEYSAPRTRHCIITFLGCGSNFVS